MRCAISFFWTGTGRRTIQLGLARSTLARPSALRIFNLEVDTRIRGDQEPGTEGLFASAFNLLSNNPQEIIARVRYLSSKESGVVDWLREPVRAAAPGS